MGRDAPEPPSSSSSHEAAAVLPIGKAGARVAPTIASQPSPLVVGAREPGLLAVYFARRVGDEGGADATGRIVVLKRGSCGFEIAVSAGRARRAHVMRRAALSVGPAGPQPSPAMPLANGREGGAGGGHGDGRAVYHDVDYRQPARPGHAAPHRELSVS